MNQNKWPDENLPTFQIEEVKAFDGERVKLTKIGQRNELGMMVRFDEPYYMLHGYFSVIDRGGRPSAYVLHLREWFMTSEIVNMSVEGEKLEIVTLNSLYVAEKS